ncbi:hypothetical protein F4553_003149 [Allocatelliglobosispora scoriae]|uniref:Right handed beta helix domain-containing protein n=2 Tax=Allocatelliglobosispora scoriae TaxID=643052 RepID=A0A841BSJ7_9ACTN|nr:hypothetical protein [Allocatelliglobosispora scoriae]
MTRITSALGLAALSAALMVGLTPAAASAHDERTTRTLDGTGSVPTYRTEGPTLLVCKADRADFESRIAAFPAELKAANLALWTACQAGGFRHLQAAVDAITLPGTIVKVLPGLYLEEPSLVAPTADCADERFAGRKSVMYGYAILEYADQERCPHLQNLVAIMGKKGVQIEGTGADPKDVVFDAQFKKLNTIRADRADGVYFRNLTAQKSQFNAIYIIETDGFVIDKSVGRWNDEYGFLTFATDHGLYTDCEGYGNGDSGVYPGAASDINKQRGYVVPRYAIEIRNCYSHHNALGYSGTAGDSVWVHDNRFEENSTGISTDSAFPDHPGMPQNHSKFEHNIIADNNVDYYGYTRDGTCKKPFEQRGYESGVVCNTVGVPVGGGVINPGGNYNIWRDNYVYGNNYAGFITSWVPGFVRNDTGFAQQFDTSHHNRYYGNSMGVTPEGRAAPNGLDFWWDGQGVHNCWRNPTSTSGSYPEALPVCGDDDLAGIGTTRWIGEPAGTLKMYTCANYSISEQRIPVDCDWFGASGLQRIEVKWALGEAIVLVLLLIGLVLRRLRGSLLATAGLAVTAVGLGLGVVGAQEMGSPLNAVGLALVGAGFVGVALGLRHRGTRALGSLTLLIALFALLGAVDRGLVMIPYIPVSPALVRVLLEAVWIPWAMIAVLVVRRPTVGVPAEGEPDPLPA